jgi:hypothetical protein
MIGRIAGLLVLLVWGLIKSPIETHMATEHQRQQFGGYKLSASLRQQAGQAGFVAVLGGLRSAVADIMWLRAFTAWQDAQYGRMKLYFDICTSLQPHREEFWDVAAWHMAWNAATYVEDRDPNITDPLEREREKRKYWKIGEDYLLQGVENNPNSWMLYERLGGFYRDKLKDPCKAAAAYAEAAKRPGHLAFVPRFAAMFLADCPGHEQEAYDQLLHLWNKGKEERLPGLVDALLRMEEKLEIPNERRIAFLAMELVGRPGQDEDAYDQLRSIFQRGRGGYPPGMIDALQRLEEKIGIPMERRIDIPPDQRIRPH